MSSQRIAAVPRHARLDGIIVFPITAVSVRAPVLVAGAVIWPERLCKWGLAGIAATLIGMSPLTLPP